MDRLLHTITKIQDTQAAIYKLEGSLRPNQLDETVQMTLTSLHKMQNKLEKEFSQLAHAEFLDVCEYKFEPNGNTRPPIGSLAKVLSDFQQMFTIVFDSIKTGPKERASYNEEIAKESSLLFGYTFAGSVGFVMTIPNERLLAIESELDRTMEYIFKISKAETTDEIAALVPHIGIASIRKVYDWAKDHVDYSMNANVRWKRQEEVRAELFVQTPEFERLTRTIDQISEERLEEITLNGRLVGFDSKARTFHLEFEKGAEDIKGQVVEGFSARGEITINDRYNAKIRKVTTIRYSTEKENIRHYLLYLE